MNVRENAAMSYHPDDEPSGIDGIRGALAEAERQLTHLPGINGMGMAKTPDGDDAIVVYVVDRQALAQLPASVGGFPVIGEVTGEIRAL